MRVSSSSMADWNLLLERDADMVRAVVPDREHDQKEHNHDDGPEPDVCELLQASLAQKVSDVSPRPRL